jgi:NADH dehydrogenase
MPSAHRVVILGAGFGGIQTYLSLRKARRPNLQITLINKTNYFLFTPLLHEVATGGLGHHNVVESVREIIDRDSASFLQAEIKDYDMNTRVVHTSAGDVPYDTLVIATGATTAFYGIPGAQEHGYVLKNLSDALRMRDRVIDLFEEASHKNAAERKKMLSFVVVGGGATGIEIVTELADLFNDTFKRFYSGDFKRKEVSLTVVAADPDILMPFHPSIRKRAEKILAREGITIKLKMEVSEVTPDGLVFKDGTTLPAQTVIWAAGVTPTLQPPQGMTCDRGHRIMVNQFLQAEGQERIFALGDAACFAGANGKPLPMLAQVAVQQGPIAAQNILNSLDKKPLVPFTFHMKGLLVSLGRLEAAAQLGAFRFSGPLAWFFWRSVYFFEFHSWSKRFKIAADWFVNLFFPRDITRA